MDSYFQQQDWYKKQHENVDGFLTYLEKENIRLMQRV